MTPTDLPDMDALWDYGDPAATERRFRALLPAAQDAPAYRLELLSQIARTLSLQRRFDEAHAILDELERELPPDAARPRIRAWLERGRTYNSSGRPDAARPLFEQALALATGQGEESLAVDAAHMLAIVAPPEQALDLNLRALALAEQATDPGARDWAGSLYNNIGWTYHALGEYQTALAYLEQAREFRAAHGQTDRWRIARWCVARVLRDLDRVPEALAEQEALRAEYDALGEPSGYVFEELGECLLRTGDAAAARPHFARAYTLLSEDAWLVANEPDRLARLNQLGAG